MSGGEIGSKGGGVSHNVGENCLWPEEDRQSTAQHSRKDNEEDNTHKRGARGSLPGGHQSNAWV